MGRYNGKITHYRPGEPIIARTYNSPFCTAVQRIYRFWTCYPPSRPSQRCLQSYFKLLKFGEIYRFRSYNGAKISGNEELFFHMAGERVTRHYKAVKRSSRLSPWSRFMSSCAREQHAQEENCYMLLFIGSPACERAGAGMRAGVSWIFW